MFLYKEYVKERIGANIIHDDCGFLQYQINDDICYINEIYVLPKFRKQQKSVEMVNLLVEVLRAVDVPKIKNIICTIYIDTQGYQRSLYSALKYGFSIIKLDDKCIYLQKEL